MQCLAFFARAHTRKNTGKMSNTSPTVGDLCETSLTAAAVEAATDHGTADEDGSAPGSLQSLLVTGVSSPAAATASWSIQSYCVINAKTDTGQPVEQQRQDEVAEEHTASLQPSLGAATLPAQTVVTANVMSTDEKLRHGDVFGENPPSVAEHDSGKLAVSAERTQSPQQSQGKKEFQCVLIKHQPMMHTAQPPVVI